MTHDDLIRIIIAALNEDVGTGDLTSELLIPAETQAEMRFVAREPMIACGTFIPEKVYAQLSDAVKTQVITNEGMRAEKGTVLARASGPARAILTGERAVLNLMQRMCGVATLTAAYVDAVKGTNAVILDTRKTMPGLRSIDKYAVKAGGGQNHRMGLYDMVLIKDNHIALCGGVAEAIRKTQKGLASHREGGESIQIVVECDTLRHVEEALAAGPDRILLDNMDPAHLRKAVAMAAGKIPLEASGGVSLETVKGIAQTGVDYISIGRLTHSAVAMDIGGDVVLKPLASSLS